MPDDPALVGVKLVAGMPQVALASSRFEGISPVGSSGAGNFDGPLPQ